MKRRPSYLSLTFKFGVFLALVSIFPLLVLGITSYNTSRSVIQKEVGGYTQALMLEQKDYLELILEQAESLITNISGVEDIRNIITNDGQYESGDTYTRLNMQAQIGYILSGYISLRGLTSIDIFTSDGAHYHVGDTLNIREINNDALERIYAKALSSDESILWVGVEDNVNTNSTHKKVVTAAKLLWEVDVESLQEKPAALLLVNYSTESLHDHFSQVDWGEEAIMMIVDTEGRLIFHTDKRFIGSQVSPFFLEQLIANERSFITEIDGQEMLVTYNKSAMSGWSLISLIPIKNLTTSANTILNILVLVLGASFIFIAMIAVNFSKTMVAPIKRLTSLFQQIQVKTFDWQVRLTEKRNDEIGELFLWFNTFLDSLDARKQAENEREQAEKELQLEQQKSLQIKTELINELEAKNTELEQFTYTVSHDLKSPLVTINGYLGYLEKDAKSGNTERLKKDVQRIQEATNKMHALLTELLELSRIGRMMNEPEDIPFDNLIKEALDIVHGQLETNQITVHTQENLPIVHGDRQRLTQVLQNLIDNAAKYMGDQPNPRIEIGQQGEDPEHGQPIFFVKDNGMGIDPEYHERIFGLFNKLDPKSDGTGVGLALVKRIIEFHGGRIWIESKAGEGSVFYFTLRCK